MRSYHHEFAIHGRLHSNRLSSENVILRWKIWKNDGVFGPARLRIPFPLGDTPRVIARGAPKAAAGQPDRAAPKRKAPGGR
jgi:hypothetical protein